MATHDTTEQQPAKKIAVLLAPETGSDIVAVWRDGGSWLTLRGGVGSPTEYSQTQMWSRTTLGAGLTRFNLVERKEDTWRSIMDEANPNNWADIPPEGNVTGMIEPDWLHVALVAGAGTTEATPGEPEEPELSAAEKAKATRKELADVKLADGRVFYPSWVHPPEGNSPGLSDIRWGRMLKEGNFKGVKRRGMLIVGGPGTGKSLFGAAIAGPGYGQVDFAEGSDGGTIIGLADWAEGKGTFWNWSPIVTAMKHRHDDTCPKEKGKVRCGKSTVICNEINLLLAEHGTLLHPLFDNPSGIFVVGEGWIEAGPDFFMIGTLNQYAGPIADALRSRLGRPLEREIQWSVVEKLGVHPDAIKVAKLLHKAKARHELDGEAPGPRELIDITHAIEEAASVMSEVEALKFGMDGFLGWDVSEMDEPVIVQAIEAVCGFTPSSGGRGSRR